MEYEFQIQDPDEITLLHFHCGTAGTNGALLVVFFADDGSDLESLAGNITNGDIAKDESGETIICEGVRLATLASLYQAMKNGSIYLNVHSKDFPGGVNRGQIFTSPPPVKSM